MYFTNGICLLALPPHAISAIGADVVPVISRDFTPTNFGPDCDWAHKYHSSTWLSCTSTIKYPNFLVQSTQIRGAVRTPTLSYLILMTGTGQNVTSWCSGIANGIIEACGPRTISNYVCTVNTNSMATYSLDGDNNWQLVLNPGLQLQFDLIYGRGATFSGLDHDHKCMAEAISTGTCSDIIVANGAACVSDGYVPPEIDGSDNDDIPDNGPANDPFKNQ